MTDHTTQLSAMARDIQYCSKPTSVLGGVVFVFDGLCTFIAQFLNHVPIAVRSGDKNQEGATVPDRSLSVTGYYPSKQFPSSVVEERIHPQGRRECRNITLPLRTISLK